MVEAGQFFDAAAYRARQILQCVTAREAAAPDQRQLALPAFAGRALRLCGGFPLPTSQE
jgi:hypothetical protein